MRFRDFLRVSVLLYGGAATALAVVSVVGATRADTNTLVYVAAVWWCVAALVGLWLGRRLATTDGIARLWWVQTCRVGSRPPRAATAWSSGSTALHHSELPNCCGCQGCDGSSRLRPSRRKRSASAYSSINWVGRTA